MKNGWTGGQYSLFRVGLGAYLCLRFARLVPWGGEVFSNQGVLPEFATSPLIHVFPNIFAVCDAPAFITGFLCAAAILSLCLAAGVADRAAAIALWYISACLFGRNPLISNPSLPYIGWLLLAHACLPPGPFGSWRARRRINPGGDWQFPGWVFASAWVVMSLGYFYSGITKLASPSWINGNAIHHVLRNPLARPTFLRDIVLALPPFALAIGTWSALVFELAFAPLAIVRRMRPIVWSVMLAMHFGLMFLIDFAELSLGMILLHMFTFDPAWIARAKAGLVDKIFYDGYCGLCHTVVRFVLAEDRFNPSLFRFAPLGGETFKSAIPQDQRERLPDSVVVLTEDGRILCRSRAILYILARLGGLWRLLTWVVAPVPWILMDWVYDVVAGLRHRIFARPADACPLLEPVYRERFMP